MAYVVTSCLGWDGVDCMHTYQDDYGNPLPSLGSSLSHSVLCFAVAMLLDGGISKPAVVEYEMEVSEEYDELRASSRGVIVLSNAQECRMQMDERTAVWMYVRMRTQRQ